MSSKYYPHFLQLIFFTILFLVNQHTLATTHVDDHQLIISCDDWAGYCNQDGSGWYLDMLREIYSAENITVKLKSEPFVRGLESVKNGSAHALLDGYNIPERQAHYVFPKIRIDTEQTVAVFNPGTQPYDINSTAKVHVGFVRGYAYQDYFNQHMQITELNRRTQGIEMLALKRIDYFVDDFMDALQAINEARKQQDDFEFSRVATKALYMMFEKSARGQQLADIYDRGFVKLYESSRVKALAQKYQIPEYSVYYPEIDNTQK